MTGSTTTSSNPIPTNGNSQDVQSVPVSSSLQLAPEQQQQRERHVFLARLAEQSERFEEMVENMKTVAKMDGPELTVEERNFLSLGYKNVVGSRRASWRMISSLYQKEEQKSNTAHLEDIRAYRIKVETELEAICKDALALLDEYLIPKAISGESKVFYLKMKGDYLRYLAEFLADDARKEVAEKAKTAYLEATAVANQELSPTQPIRLGLALNFSVFHYEIMGMPRDACMLAKQAFDDALAEIDALSEESYRDSTVIMQLLRNNVDLWQVDSEPKVSNEDVANAESKAAK